MRQHPNLDNIAAIVTDVDGVLTDGSIFVTPRGEAKNFNVKDGMGFKLAQKAGLKTAILTGRLSKAVEMRAKELGIDVAKMGRLDKQTALLEIESELGIPLHQMVYIGDDLPDLAPLEMVALGFCPLDAHEVVREQAHVVPVPGGRGVFREVVELILKNQGKWEDLLSSFRKS
ncbi:MAG: phenylphosphate carboxylase subunit delta [Acidobacteria bacterium]|nr:MAG: phenylphosphate carboxylase subunit delta [Acidobacteriota bacterium]